MSTSYTLKPARPKVTTITLHHPGLPGVMVTIKPGILRRLGLRTSAFATLSETYGTSKPTENGA
jgi:hypothetical protein